MLRRQSLSNVIIGLSIALLISAASVLDTWERDARAGWAPPPERDRIVRLERVNEHKSIGGITRDRRQHMSYGAIEPEVFCNFRSSFSSGNLLFAVQSRGRAKAMATAVRDAIHLIDERIMNGKGTEAS